MDNPFITQSQSSSEGKPQVDFIMNPYFKNDGEGCGFYMNTGEKTSEGRAIKTKVSDVVEGKLEGIAKNFYRQPINAKDFLADEEGTDVNDDGVRGYLGNWQIELYLNKEGKKALVRFNVSTNASHSILNTIAGAESIEDIMIKLENTGIKNNKGGDVINAKTVINGDWKAPWKYSMEELKAMDIVAKVGSVTVTDTSPRYMRLLEEAVAKKPLDMEKRDELMSQLAELEVKVVVADTKSVDEDDSMPF